MPAPCFGDPTHGSVQVTRILSFDRAFAAPILALALFCPGAWAEAPPKAAALKVISIKVGAHPLKVEVADTPETSARGLMFREKMGKNDGMLFVFRELGYHSMWMMNTYIPLSVAFVDGEGRILNILDMEPRTQDTHTSAGPARYAIETNKGWFAEKKIKAGDKVTGLPKF
jgi:uncharacterized membrane protein (UPF0127 family)